MSLNKVILIGNVGQDPEIRSTQQGSQVASFSLATTDTWKDKSSGERKSKTEWHRIVVFNDSIAGVIKNYVKKGSKLYIEGSLQTRKWQDNNGVEKFTTEIILQNYNGRIELLDKKDSYSDSSEPLDNETQASNTQSKNKKSPSNNSKKQEIEDQDEDFDEVPF